MKDTFSSYHPLVQLSYFILVIALTMLLMHPICLLLSLVCAILYAVQLKGRGMWRFQLLYMLPLLLLTALFNPLFNHAGVTIVGYLPSGNPITLEAIAYGIAAALMLVAIISWFACYNEVMTSDRFIYLFGRILPSLSLVLSMVLRFVPRFKEQLAEVVFAQRCIGKDWSQGSLLERSKNGLRILSIMTTWMLENAVDTADAMKSRGYGLQGRTTFSLFSFERRDKQVLLFIGVLGAYLITGIGLGAASYRYFPSLKGADLTLYGLSFMLAYAALCLLPVVIHHWEERKWRLSQLKN